MTTTINASTSAGLVNTADTSGILQLQTAGTAAVTIDASQNVGIGVTPAGTGGCLQLKSGITFPATQSASSDANTLDDYEEGTFSPSATPASGSFTTVTQSGNYTKVGNVVNYSFIVTINSVGTGSGDVNIVLPFTCGISPIRPMGCGRENALSGNTLQVRTTSDGSANASILMGPALANGWQALCTITYTTST
jgi:hypothetical protein